MWLEKEYLLSKIALKMNKFQSCIISLIAFSLTVISTLLPQISKYIHSWMSLSKLWKENAYWIRTLLKARTETTWTSLTVTSSPISMNTTNHKYHQYHRLSRLKGKHSRFLFGKSWVQISARKRLFGLRLPLLFQWNYSHAGISVL